MWNRAGAGVRGGALVAADHPRIAAGAATFQRNSRRFAGPERQRADAAVAGAGGGRDSRARDAAAARQCPGLCADAVGV